MSSVALPWALGAAWGVALAVPIARRAARVAPVTRAQQLAVRPRRRAVPRLAPTWFTGVRRAHSNGVVVRVARSLVTRHARRASVAELARELPVALDLLGVAVGAGCTPYLAIEVAARWAPPVTAAAFEEVLRGCALGIDLESALDERARAEPSLRPLVGALLATERLGVPVGPVLTRLAEEDRTSLRRAAEAHARRIPVRLLFPLVFLVLPAFVLLTVVPGLAAGLGRL